MLDFLPFGIVNLCVFVFADSMSLCLLTIVSSSKVVGYYWSYIALVLLLSCSSTLESAAKCETCRDLVKHFMEVVDVALDFLNKFK